MPAKKSTPVARASAQRKNVERVRRKYKTNLKSKRRILPSEEKHITTMCVVLQLASYNRSQIAAIVGISRGQVRERLDSPDGSELLILMRQRLPQAALELLQGYMIEAVQAIVDVLRTEKQSKYVLQAAGEILDRAGIPKSSKQERHQLNEEKLTVTDDGLLEKLREASPEVQEQAAQAIEQLESLLATAATEKPTEDEDE